MRVWFSGKFVSQLMLLPLCGTLLLPAAFSKSHPPIKASTSVKSTSAEQVKLALDKGKSNVAFTVTHMVVSEVEGNFKVFNGSMEYTKPDFSDAKIDFTVDVKSVNTNNANRDKHLRSDDFFNVEKFPVMKFVSTSFVHQEGSSYKLAGNLTIRDVTKPVTFNVSYPGLSADQKTAIFEARTTIDRFDYNLKWSKMTEAGGLVVSSDIKVNVKAAFRVK